MSFKTRAILVLVIGTVMGLGLSVGSQYLRKPDTAAANLTWEQARLFAEVMDRVKRDYVEQVDDRELLESAIRGMVADLDAHSQFLDAAEYEDIRISTTGSYSGVGLEVSTEDGEILIVTPIDDTPAQRAGILPGDVITAIDGTSVAAEGLQKTIGRMRGRPGSLVTITLLRGEEKEVHVFSLRRESIQVASVRHELLDPAYGYVRVSQFNDTTADELSRAIDDLLQQAQKAQGNMLSGLVLDLRNNPGGVLDAAVDVSDLFLDSGIIVTADGRTPESRFTRKAHRGDILDGAPMVVLVNSGSASASEIVAGALRDHHRALILGTSTFGKGLVQTVMPLSRGRAIKLTTSRYYTPSGESINETGITPDVIVEGSLGHPGLRLNAGVDSEADTQLNEAVLRLRNQRILQSSAE
ncbi:MAG: S41 family peptidase [Gammaproteobacteria bacterium]|nr:S41 family peptidase [Gammaproteobacteria bacterium]MDH4316605.1 S41 family peptidase [Gammaproteobacteria bacterium]MDH5215358.1 S41 family peptidase [Gammaproteobacteria bacterium]MDH5501905.1 S41 family peptidase [Gammaproteobacteria bacterium]